MICSFLVLLASIIFFPIYFRLKQTKKESVYHFYVRFSHLEDIDTKRTKKMMKKREHMTLGLIMMSILNTLRALPLVGFFLYFNLAELVTPQCKR